MTLPQYMWFVDDANVSTALSNSNAGKDATHPISGEELSRRLGPRRLLADMTVTVLSDSAVPALDINLNGHQFTILGQPTVSDSGTLNSFNAQNRATPTYNRITVSSVPATAVARLMRIPSGGRAGTYWWGVSNASGTVTISTPAQFPVAVVDQSLTRVTPVAADPYQTLTLPKLTIDAAVFDGGSLTSSTSPGKVLLQTLDVNVDTIRSPIFTVARACKLTSYWSSGGGFLANNAQRGVLASNCQFGDAAWTSDIRAIGGYASSSQVVTHGCTGLFDYDFLLNSVVLYATGRTTMGSLALFGSGQIQVLGHIDSAALSDGAEAFWGNNSASVAMQVFADGEFACNTRPTATGNGGVAKVGQFTLSGWDKIPFRDESQNATVALQ